MSGSSVVVVVVTRVAEVVGVVVTDWEVLVVEVVVDTVVWVVLVVVGPTNGSVEGVVVVVFDLLEDWVEVVDTVVGVVLVVVGPTNGVVKVVVVVVVGFVSDVVVVVSFVFCGTIVSLSCAVNAQPEALTEKYAFSQGFFAVMTSSEVS